MIDYALEVKGCLSDVWVAPDVQDQHKTKRSAQNRNFYESQIKI